MAYIKVLNNQTIDKIAAGEVVNRPASVVKELVENSIDAQAEDIIVEIFNGGLSFISVTDNGMGIDFYDVETAFKRHTTSKIYSFEDLEKITTLGFRGEALASIAAVSKIEIFTKTKKDTTGLYMELVGGEIRRKEELGMPPGTKIIVRDLFFNVPVRRKHLKNINSETAAVGDCISKLLLANPSKRITYKVDGSLIFKSSGNNKLIDSISSTLGSDAVKKMSEVRYKDGSYYINGYTSLLEYTRGNRSCQYFIVNGRCIYSKLLSEALDEAYHTLLPKNRFPIAVLSISAPSELIDVNVHPTKNEIRWMEHKKIKKAVQDAVFLSIKESGLIVGHNFIKNESTINASRHIKKSENDIKNIYYNEEHDNNIKNIKEQEHFVFDKKTDYWTDLIPFKQIDNTYILAQYIGKEGFFIIDQHAAHERIIYDFLIEKLKTFEAVSQTIITPITIELTPAENSIIYDYLDILHEFGFVLEHFGSNTFVIRTIPSGISKLNPEEFIKDFLSDKKENIDKEKAYNELLQLIACKGAVKAGEKMEMEEMRRLLLKLKNTSNPFTCPHGRPVSIYFSKEDLVKIFYR